MQKQMYHFFLNTVYIAEYTIINVGFHGILSTRPPTMTALETNRI